MRDDDYGPLLLQPLAGDPTGPPGIDVPTAMRDGLRRRHRRWWTGGAGLLAAVVAATVAATVSGSALLATAGGSPHPKPTPTVSLPPEPAVPASCTMSVLPKGGYPTVGVTGGDSSGRWQVGTAAPVYGSNGPILVWHDGQIVARVPNPGGGRTMSDINSSGVAVGTDEGQPQHPYVLRDGKITLLKGGKGTAVAINDNGVIAGTLDVNGKQVPARWASADAQPQILPLPKGATPGSHVVTSVNHIVDIAPDGTIAAENLSDPLIWLPDGTVHEIKGPRGSTMRPVGFAFGWLYGEAFGQSSSGPAGIPAMEAGGMARYDPRSGTWQALTGSALFPGGGTGGDLNNLTKPLAAFVGKQTMKLPAEPVPGQNDKYMVDLTSISTDATVVTGTALSSHSDPALPFQPLIWHCR